MTIENIATILQPAGIPVSYQDFPDENCPPMPYIIFEDTGTNNFHADGIVIKTFTKIKSVLYTAEKAERIEADIEEALNEAGIGWTKEVEEDDQERCMLVTYQFEVIGG